MLPVNAKSGGVLQQAQLHHETEARLVVVHCGDCVDDDDDIVTLKDATVVGVVS